MDAPDRDDSRHDAFRDLCTLYLDFNRPVFIDEIEGFIRCANKGELERLRKIIAGRAADLRRGGKKGRPRALDSPAWLRKALKETWQKQVFGWSWAKIATDQGIKNPVDYKRTLQRRRDMLAAQIWRVLPPGCNDDGKLLEVLKSRRFQDHLRLEVGLPFRSNPAECKKIVLALAPRGLDAQVSILGRHTKYRQHRMS